MTRSQLFCEKNLLGKKIHGENSNRTQTRRNFHKNDENEFSVLPWLWAGSVPYGFCVSTTPEELEPGIGCSVSSSFLLNSSRKFPHNSSLYHFLGFGSVNPLNTHFPFSEVPKLTFHLGSGLHCKPGRYAKNNLSNFFRLFCCQFFFAQFPSQKFSPNTTYFVFFPSYFPCSINPIVLPYKLNNNKM